MQKNYLKDAVKKTAIIEADILLVILAAGLSLLLRFDFSFNLVPSIFIAEWMKFILIELLVMLPVFAIGRMYLFDWRSVGVYDVLHMVVCVTSANLIACVIGKIASIPLRTGLNIINLVLQLVFLVGIRCTLRFYGEFRAFLRRRARSGNDRIMLIGGGSAGAMLIRELISSEKSNGTPYCVIDDNPAKRGKYIEGTPIVGSRDMIPYYVKKFHITQIIFAIPTISPDEERKILEICRDTGCKTRKLPGIYQMVNGDVRLSDVRDVQVEDLLGRAPVQLDTEKLNGFLKGKTVLVTGGGGSIGSELCRQIVKFHPGLLIILDIYENNAYDIQQELIRNYGSELNLKVEIASIRDKEKIYALFDAYRPDIVFHAAAHKHVPLMEACPEEAIKNNVFGTYHVIRASEKFGVRRFVMISTDKAVNPTNFMGATKRFCELILQSRTNSQTEFCAVRFGNVLGSNGSVVPLFQRQIREGGPVTITDKRIIRYFMTIPEAAQLVLEAGAMAQRGEIFVLDMGEPVKILTLAENMIRLSGLEPYKDIEIREIGLRPGEKLYEELLIANETLMRTSNQKIYVERECTISPDRIMRCLTALDRAITGGYSPDELIQLMKQMVPTYYSPEQINGEVPFEEAASGAMQMAEVLDEDPEGARDNGKAGVIYNLHEAV